MHKQLINSLFNEGQWLDDEFCELPCFIFTNNQLVISLTTIASISSSKGQQFSNWIFHPNMSTSNCNVLAIIAATNYNIKIFHQHFIKSIVVFQIRTSHSSCTSQPHYRLSWLWNVMCTKKWKSYLRRYNIIDFRLKQYKLQKRSNSEKWSMNIKPNRIDVNNLEMSSVEFIEMA